MDVWNPRRDESDEEFFWEESDEEEPDWYAQLVD